MSGVYWRIRVKINQPGQKTGLDTTVYLLLERCSGRMVVAGTH